MSRPDPVRARYMRESVATASPARLVVMLYDALVKDLRLASKAIEARDPQAGHDRLVHAQAIVDELASSLRHDLWDGSTQLAQLYDFVRAELVSANISKDVVHVDNCLTVVTPLQEAWHQAIRQVEGPVGQEVSSGAAQ